ncbi:histidinol-phosphate transaminase [Terrilactibacillus sp. BCM23-1]|uniref:Histidinol-phosphate aminotransferase n=1 Tax=Terrilactibacillus tamarindi TaxID=2599694 RepID=A0A6N8CNA1_9BACI|nr:histidinol-phosphate transaminase [Terrilactibacillus tamarindi]MTT31040.1 histidinol-phosphate transaminase [Terrilactibacillus tamarindi]
MSKYWNERIQKLEPYVPGEQPKDKRYVKLNTNENPYPPSPKVLQAIRDAANDQLRLYPDPNTDDLRETLAEATGLTSDHIFVGNGSDEVLAFSFMSFFSSDRPVMFADITYSFYKVYANLCSLETNVIPLDDEFKIPVDAFCEPNGGIIIPNPNAPTGQAISIDSIRKILDANAESVVIIDEAYVNFGAESVVPLIKDYPNLLVVQTLSKYSSLAGIRVGFALGNPELIDGLNRLKNSINSYTIDRMALAGAKAAIEDDLYYKQMADKIITTRQNTINSLLDLGFKVIPSQSNFIFITHPSIQAETLFHDLKNKGILVRYFNQPRISNYLRVTIGTDDEMNQFLKVLKGIINIE